MVYILTTGWEDGITDLMERLINELTGGKNVLWLLSGGSNIKASVEIMDNISDDLSKQLTVSLIDERYGNVGHKDSNWAQLEQAGFESKNARMLPVLQEGLSFSQTADSYDATIRAALALADVVIAQLGIGPDGHIAGILENSPAANEQSNMVVAYESPPFHRLTLTFPALKHVTAAYAFAFGDAKLEALTTLRSKELPASVQPAQILKKLPEAYIYNDQIGA